MQKKRLLFLCVWLFGLPALLAGCSGLGTYAEVRPEPAGIESVSIASLQEHWKDYDVYYAGYHGKESTAYPAGLLFDPRDDDRAVTGAEWTKIADPDTLTAVIDGINHGRSSQGYYPRVWQVLGPDGALYGYLFASRTHLVAKKIDDKTLYVYDIPKPPSLDDVLKAPASGPM